MVGIYLLVFTYIHMITPQPQRQPKLLVATERALSVSAIFIIFVLVFICCVVGIYSFRCWYLFIGAHQQQWLS